MNLFLCKEKPHGIGKQTHSFKAQNHPLSSIKCGSGKFSVINSSRGQLIVLSNALLQRLERNEETHFKSSQCK